MAIRIRFFSGALTTFLFPALNSLVVLLVWGVLNGSALGQPREEQSRSAETKVPEALDLSATPAKVDVSPTAPDQEIRQRLQKVLEATDWFKYPKVEVEEGVVFLRGRANSEELKKWAGDLARNTQDVVAVVNRIEILEPSVWDMRPAWNGLLSLWREFIRALPFILFALLVLAFSVWAGVIAARASRRLLHRRIQARLLRNVVAGTIGVLVVLVGTYIVLRVSGLTQLALTIVGGTGLLGLAVGIAFRDITENFLASVFLSMQRPFETGDLVEITGVTGYVQQLNVRTTVLMTLEGNLVQIPNAMVYKNTLRNFTTNASRREDFVVGIGFEDAIHDAQEIALAVLKQHPAVLKDPEPSVLADSLGKATVNLRVYFWLNGREHSWLKVRSSVIRLVKRAFQQHGISMPDEAREVVFPQGVPVTMIEENSARPRADEPAAPKIEERVTEEPNEVCTQAEAGLYSEADHLDKQARQAQVVREEENLLPGSPGAGETESPASKRTQDQAALRSSQ